MVKQGFAKSKAGAITGATTDTKISIYGMDASDNVSPTLTLLREAGIDYEYIFTNLMTGAHKTRA